MGPDGPKWGQEDFFLPIQTLPTLWATRILILRIFIFWILGAPSLGLAWAQLRPSLARLGPGLGPGLGPAWARAWAAALAQLGPGLGPAWARAWARLGPGLGPGLGSGYGPAWPGRGSPRGGREALGWAGEALRWAGPSGGPCCRHCFCLRFVLKYVCDAQDHRPLNLF